MPVLSSYDTIVFSPPSRRLRAYLDNSASLSASTTSYDTPLRRALARKRRRQENEGLVNGEGIARLPPPPLPADDEMLILFSPDPVKLAGVSAPTPPPGPGTFGIAAFAPDVPAPKPPMVALAPGLDPRCVRARVGRCGRTMLTRCDPLTLEPHPPLDPAATAAGALANGVGSCGGPTHVFTPARHPLLLSSQQPSLPWAAVLDLELLPEGVVDKAALKALRERRLNADRNNALALRQTCAALTQQAAGGMLGTSGVTGAAAAAAAPPVPLPALASLPQPPTSAAVAAASPPVAATGPSGALPHRPPPPPGAPLQGAPAGTLPHMPAPGAPAGTLPHVPPGGTGAAPPAAVVAATPGGASLPGAGPSGSLAATPVPAVSGGAGQARKVPKAPGAPSSVAGTPAAVAGATSAAANAVAASRSPSPGGPGVAPKQVVSSSSRVGADEGLSACGLALCFSGCDRACRVIVPSSSHGAEVYGWCACTVFPNPPRTGSRRSGTGSSGGGARHASGGAGHARGRARGDPGAHCQRGGRARCRGRSCGCPRRRGQDTADAAGGGGPVLRVAAEAGPSACDEDWQQGAWLIPGGRNSARRQHLSVRRYSVMT